MDNVAKIAGSLSEAVCAAIGLLGSQWMAGPELPDEVLDQLGHLRAAGLIERRFGDFAASTRRCDEDGIAIHMSACWWFRLTPLGLAVRSHIEGNSNVG
jgi:hypothetical protein